VPLFNFICTGCREASRRILSPAEAKGLKCKQCGAALERDPQPPSTQVVESLDKGLMARRVERLRDAEILHKERAKSDPRTKDS
jgi:hypothetical protein